MKYWFLIALALFLTGRSASLSAQTLKAPSPSEWERALENGRKEGQVVVSLPASAELRKEIEGTFKQRFGIETEIVTGRGAAIIRRIAEEYKANIHYFDVHVGGSSSFISGLLSEGVLDAFEPYLVLPEVKDPKHWWGGSMWVDKSNRYIYATAAYLTQTMFYNTDGAKAEELRSYDDFLNPKWKGKIGLLDPRTPGAGDSNWSYFWMVKGEDYLRKFTAQKIALSRDQRVLSDILSKGTITIAVGLSHYAVLPFLKAGLPVKPMPPMKEGTYGTGGSGNVAVIKNAPHPNAAKLFVNWLLGKEGQEIFIRAMGQATRRLDVDTRWLKDVGVIAAKDEMTLQQYLKVENQSEEKLQKQREPAVRFAHKMFD